MQPKTATKTIKNNDKSAQLLSVNLFGGEMVEVLKIVATNLDAKKPLKPLIIFTPNPEQLVLAASDDTFSHTLNYSTINVPDGIGLIWADRFLSRFRGQPHRLTQRIPGVDLMEAIALDALKRSHKLFLLGGRDNTAQKAAKTLIKASKASASLAGFHTGATNIRQQTGPENRGVIKQINRFSPSVLFVAYGAPWQERWLIQNIHRLPSVRVAMVVGGSFDILSGNIPRAPLKWRKSGLEWLWRLLLEPWRLRRQLSLLKFIWLIFLETLRR